MLDVMASIFLDFHQILNLIIMDRVTYFAVESKDVAFDYEFHYDML